MKCPKCEAHTNVTDSRPRDGNTVFRRRQCGLCGYKFTTFEMSAVYKAKMEQTIINLTQAVNDLKDALKQTEP